MELFMSKIREKNKILIKKTAFGAIFSATASALLLIGGIFEILDMTSAALASLAVLVTYLEFGMPTALCVYGVTSVLSFVLNPVATSNVFFILLMGYFPVVKLVIDKKLKKSKILRVISKLAVFNIGSIALLFVFVKISGLDYMIREFTIGPLSPQIVFVIIFVLLNFFLVLYDKLISILSLVYVNVLRKRIFPKG